MSPHLRTAGFTLIELMIGIVIVGVLAGLAIPSFKTYVYRSRVSEAVTVLNEIKSRQEAYRSRFGNYAAVSGTTTWANWTPAAIPGSQAVSWPSSREWEELGLRSPGPVRFRYATVAGLPGEVPPAGSNLDNRTFWYAAQAEGDLNDDGTPFILEVYSQSRILYNSATGRGGWD